MHALCQGRWCTSQNIHQIWAEWAVCTSCHLLKGIYYNYNFYDFWCSNWTFTQINWQNAWDFLFASVCLHNNSDSSRFSYEFKIHLVMVNNNNNRQISLQQHAVEVSLHIVEQLFFKKCIDLSLKYKNIYFFEK